MPKKFLYLEEFIEDIKLDNKQKVKLIELLLLVSSILTFKLSDDLIGAFMMVVLFSIVYWIILQKHTIRSVNSISTVIKYLIPAMISFFFVFIVTSIQFFNIMKLSDPITTMPGILFIIYFFVLFFIIWVALSPDLDRMAKK